MPRHDDEHETFYLSDSECSDVIHCCACLAGVLHHDFDGSGCEWCDASVLIVMNVVTIGRFNKDTWVDFGLVSTRAPKRVPQHIESWHMGRTRPRIFRRKQK